jgi:hypothetical protein
MNDMSPSELEANTAFFEMLHRLLGNQQQGGGRERRRSARRSYECEQLLAFYDGRTAPPPTDFRPVLCHDLSPGGFSFFADQRPPTGFVVAALGNVPFSFFAAEVLSVRPDHQAGGEGCLVGCRFVRRIVTPADLVCA